MLCLQNFTVYQFAQYIKEKGKNNINEDTKKQKKKENKKTKSN